MLPYGNPSPYPLKVRDPIERALTGLQAGLRDGAWKRVDAESKAFAVAKLREWSERFADFARQVESL